MERIELLNFYFTFLTEALNRITKAIGCAVNIDETKVNDFKVRLFDSTTLKYKQTLNRELTTFVLARLGRGNEKLMQSKKGKEGFRKKAAHEQDTRDRLAQRVVLQEGVSTELEREAVSNRFPSNINKPHNSEDLKDFLKGVFASAANISAIGNRYRSARKPDDRADAFFEKCLMLENAIRDALNLINCAISGGVEYLANRHFFGKSCADYSTPHLGWSNLQIPPRGGVIRKFFIGF